MLLLLLLLLLRYLQRRQSRQSRRMRRLAIKIRVEEFLDLFIGATQVFPRKPDYFEALEGARAADCLICRR